MLSVNDFAKSEEDNVVSSVLPRARSYVTLPSLIDFSIDFNQQESLSHSLIFCQICYAIAMQKFGGTFVLKLFDIFAAATIDLVYILSSLYKVFKINSE